MDISPSKRTRRVKIAQENSFNSEAGHNSAKALPSPPVTPSKNRLRDISNEIGGSDSGVKKLCFTTPPNTPTKPKQSSVYSQAKALFQRSADSTKECAGTSHLFEREQEAQTLIEFLKCGIEERCCNSICISGPPGTGKTAQVDVTLKNITGKRSCIQSEGISKVSGKSIKILKFNCMSLSHPENIFHQIHCALDTTKNFATCHKKKMTADDVFHLLVNIDEIDHAIIVLDEMDCLVTHDQQVLFQLFNFASSKHSHNFKCKMTLIGISNSLDFTDKFLPKLKKNNLAPQTLPFPPYTSNQIQSIITKKLKSLLLNQCDKENGSHSQFVPIIHPVAIQLCCKKAASVTGDLRKALDLCYKSIELMEAGLRKTNPVLDFNFLDAPRVKILHVASVCENSFKLNGSARLKNLNLLQKAVLCCLFSCSTSSSILDITINAFYDYYIKQMRLDINNLLAPLKKGEFIEIIHALEASSVVLLSDKKGCRNIASEFGSKFIKPNVSYNDLVASIGTVGVLKKILHT